MALTAVALSAAVAGCGTAGSVDRCPAAAPGSSALAALRALPVKEHAAETGYSRAQFGPNYADTNHDGCDTRNNALQRDLKDVNIKPGTHGCVVLSGTLTDPYGGSTIAYTKGAHSPIDYEHVVALEDAWVTGAQQLTPEQRQNLANDPLNVLMVSSSSNRSKHAKDASAWLPPAKSYRCAYVARQVSVKARYSLSVTPAERAAIEHVLASCPHQPLPTEAQAAYPALQ